MMYGNRIRTYNTLYGNLCLSNSVMIKKSVYLCLSEYYFCVWVIYAENFKDSGSFLMSKDKLSVCTVFFRAEDRLTVFQKLIAFDICSCACITRLDQRLGVPYINNNSFEI